jgi:hypothetical protein
LEHAGIKPGIRPVSESARGMMSEFLFGTFCVRGIIIYSRFTLSVVH